MSKKYFVQVVLPVYAETPDEAAILVRKMLSNSVKSDVYVEKHMSCFEEARSVLAPNILDMNDLQNKKALQWGDLK